MWNALSKRLKKYLSDVKWIFRSQKLEMRKNLYEKKYKESLYKLFLISFRE